MQSLVSYRRPTLSALLEDEIWSRHWVRSGCLEVYVRKGKHLVEKGKKKYIKSCLMVANWGLKGCRHRNYEGKRARAAHLLQLVEFMKEVEKGAIEGGFDGVFVEHVDERAVSLLHLLRKHGYAEGRMEATKFESINFFKSRERILSTSPWVEKSKRQIHSFQRASLRRFLRDPVLARFWVVDQATGIHMQLKREWITDSPRASKKRLGVCDLFYGQVERNSTGLLCWDNDHARVIELLERIGAQAAREGFSELGLASDAISSSQSGVFQQISRARETMAEELAWRGYDLEPGPIRRGSVLYYVRTLVGDSRAEGAAPARPIRVAATGR